MAIKVGKQAKVTLETPDGLVHDITGYVRSFQIEQGLDRYMTATIEIYGDSLHTMFMDDRIAQIKSSQDRREWKCDYCGMINPMTARHCGGDDKRAVGCGAARSYVYDL